MATLRVRDLMTSDVLVVREDDAITRAQDLMADKRIRHVPVVDEDGELVGLVSERDMLRRALGRDADLPLSVREDVLTAVRIRDIMTPEIEAVESSTELAVAAQLMLDNQYGCLPVVDGSTLTGILTEADFVRFVAEGAGATHPSRE